MSGSFCSLVDGAEVARRTTERQGRCDEEDRQQADVADELLLDVRVEEARFHVEPYLSGHHGRGRVERGS
jgi:hypothetical protein